MKKRVLSLITMLIIAFNICCFNISADNGGISLFSTTYPEIVDIVAGGYHSIAHDRSGDVYVFGSNRYGEIGIGTTSEEGVVYDISIDDSGDATKVSSRGDHILTIGTDGKVYSWGYNNHGQLGIGNWSNQSSATAVNGLPDNIIDIAAGHQFSLALTEDGYVYAWGHGGYGQIGNGATIESCVTPVKISSLSDVKYISAGHYHALAIKNDGTVWGWGRNTEGQLGNGTTTNVLTPIQLDVTGVKDAVAGFNNSFFLKNDGTVYACGNNTEGELGDGTQENKTEPILIEGVSNVIQVSSNSCTVFLQEDGIAYGTGSNKSGQLGFGNKIGRVLIPTKIPGDGYTKVSVGGNHTLLYWGTTYDGSTHGGKIYAMGNNEYYQCGQQGMNYKDKFTYPTLITHIQEIDDRQTWAPIYSCDNGMTQNVLFASEDTYISQHGDTNSENYATNEFCSVNYTRKDNGAEDWGQYSYFKFDISEIDTTRKLTAKLYVYVDETSDVRSSTRTIGIYNTETSAWTDSDLTWNSGVVQDGGNLLGTFEVTGNGSIITDAGWREIDITQYLQEFTGDELSLMAKMTSTTAHPVNIRSRDYYTYTAPVLVVDVYPEQYVTVDNVSVDYNNDEIILSGEYNITDNNFKISLENRYGDTYTYDGTVTITNNQYIAKFPLEAPKYGENTGNLIVGNNLFSCDFEFEIEDEKVNGQSFDNAIRISCDKIVKSNSENDSGNDAEDTYFSFYPDETTSYILNTSQYIDVAKIYDSNKNLIFPNRVNGVLYNLNVESLNSTYLFEKDKKYYIVCRNKEFKITTLRTHSENLGVEDIEISNNDIKLSNYEDKIYKFTASHEGIFDFKFNYPYDGFGVNNENEEVFIDTQTLYDENFLPVKMLQSVDINNNPIWSVKMMAGEKVYIRLKSISNKEHNAILDISENNSYDYIDTNNELIMGNQILDIGENEYKAYKIHALNDGIYSFKTTGNADMTAYLYKDRELIATSDFDTYNLSGEINKNFNLVYEFTPEEDYVLVIKNKSNAETINLTSKYLGFHLPLSGGEMPLDYNEYYELYIAPYNCYNYATGIYGINEMLQPGALSNNIMSSSYINEIFYDSTIDSDERINKLANYFSDICAKDMDLQARSFYIAGEDEFGDTDKYKVALVLEFNNTGEYYDYHWYRQNNNGLWAHKPGMHLVTKYDNSYNLIYRPDCVNANTGIYNVFVGYFLIDKPTISFNALNDIALQANVEEQNIPMTKEQYTLEEFDFITNNTTRTEIISKLGNPNKSVGSGMIIHEYNLDNTNKVRISYDFDNESIWNVSLIDCNGYVLSDLI